ncbi:MAG: phosphoglycerate kinase [Gammaproteobacteria bacterium]
MTLDSIVSTRILVRFDFNVPMNNGNIVNDFRIKQSLETIHKLLANKNKIIIVSHLGRPTEGVYEESLSLKPICKYLSTLLERDIKFFNSYRDNINFENYEIAMLENVRFNTGEKSSDSDLSKAYASLADYFVFDAFGVSHRKESSTFGVSEYLKTFPGLNISNEISTINQLINEDSRPMTIIISGAKVSTKLIVIKKLLAKCDFMILGGGILNTFLKAKGSEIGKSLYEEDLVNEAKNILSSDFSSKIIFPIDMSCESESKPKNIDVSNISNNDIIFDVGEKSLEHIKSIINKSAAIFWNGPLGYVEKEPFDIGTIELAKTIAEHNCFSIIGGGDTLPIIENLNLQSQFSCLSTGGGSLLTYLEGGDLPILDKLDFNI